MSEYIPCPFCGGTDIGASHTGDQTDSVWCNSCAAFAGDAAAHWNTRTTPWRPFSEAPKDGTPILACIAGAEYYTDKIQFMGGCWLYPCLTHGPSKLPTHFMPLPAPPTN